MPTFKRILHLACASLLLAMAAGTAQAHDDDARIIVVTPRWQSSDGPVFVQPRENEDWRYRRHEYREQFQSDAMPRWNRDQEWRPRRHDYDEDARHRQFHRQERWEHRQYHRPDPGSVYYYNANPD